MNQPWDISIAQGAGGPVRLAGKATGQPSGGGGGVVLSATVTLTDAQIKALRSATIEVIPAPDADQMIVVLGGLITTDHTAGNYTNITASGNVNTASLSLVYGDDDAQASTYLDPTSLLASATPSYGVIAASGAPFVVVDDIQSGHASGLGKNVRIVAYNTDGNYTGGDAANTMRVTAFYAIVDVS